MPKLKYGVDYGLKLVRNPIVAILCNIPILNLFFTKKLHFDVTYFGKNAEGLHPATGVFNDIHVPFWQKKFRVIYSLDYSAATARVYVYSFNREWRYPVRERWANVNIAPLVWYVSDITIGKKER